MDCTQHAGVAATAICTRCDQPLCAACLHERNGRQFCANCAEFLDRRSVQRARPAGSAPGKIAGEITLQGIQSNSAKLHEASRHFLDYFAGTSDDIITGVAGASAIAGLMILRSTGIDLGKYEPGDVILSEEVNQKQDPVIRYIAAIGHKMGVDPDAGINEAAVKNNRPPVDAIDLRTNLKSLFTKLAKRQAFKSYTIRLLLH